MAKRQSARMSKVTNTHLAKVGIKWLICSCIVANSITNHMK